MNPHRDLLLNHGYLQALCLCSGSRNQGLPLCSDSRNAAGSLVWSTCGASCRNPTASVWAGCRARMKEITWTRWEDGVMTRDGIPKNMLEHKEGEWDMPRNACSAQNTDFQRLFYQVLLVSPATFCASGTSLSEIR